MIPLLELDPKKRCKDLAVAAATREAVAAEGTGTAAIVMMAAVAAAATVTVAATETEVAIGLSLADLAVDTVVRKSPLFPKAAVANSSRTISESRPSLGTTLSTFTM